MEYFTSSEMAEVWSVSRRRVSVLCKEGRIDGAILKGKTWLIPSNAVKPEDGRHFKKKKAGEMINDYRRNPG